MQANHRNCQAVPPCERRISRTEGGFTLTELIVTMSVAAILATVAVPSFNGIIANQRGKTLASALYATLAKTRSAALTLNGNVTLQPKAGNWQNGWQILDPNNNVLDDYTAATGITIAGPAAVTYRSSGRLPVGAAPMFQISTTSGAAVNYQCVSVDLSGRPRMTATQTC
jgi:type IV fimbrial biogenesis protein FimT